MRQIRNRTIASLVGAVLALAACSAAPTEPANLEPASPEPASDARPPLGLMSSLPLYWPADADIADIAADRAAPPWQRRAIETRYRPVPLDTLTPIPALSPDTPETDPLADLDRLAVIQPRGLSPGDNVALDAWVRGGGSLLLVLDPATTGDYDLPLGDPRRPVETALIPPVVERWGLAVSFDERQALAVADASLGGAALPLALPGRIAVTDPAAADCTLAAEGAAAACRVGKGRVTLIADAALFEHPELAGENGQTLAGLLAAAFE
ncbi:hypothetical protein [Erythrobacter sp.]|uniref:hypothetical protein n=1 Tax=Erythrobacter sp. TaxID=1042 RepID=UPI0025F90643|nr:hypothetical protein [Erythrobacter sp.]